ncbi:hypothetical protein JIN85_18760 [Luteolibacter pohnpeiensis]|uniref:Uncharacterized protein n=1 Tax=Luteolibacter pohnpeiensis TaxID=454153 RepID=A0A934VXK6_9BACT|nr:hypothetical protein [Luteolibacter pohnpeiensis]MBK1884465.1 hypothetical protein [Luteolibacter pohnpeiensis]
MSPLPQRKKTAEELAKLREGLGIPDAPPPGAPGVARELRNQPANPANAPSPQKPLPQAGSAPLPPPAPAKPVRSLKKSERLPAPTSASSEPRTSLPSYRHSQQDLDELRRREAFTAQSPAIQLQEITAHPALIGVGYALVVGTLISAIMHTHGAILLSCGAIALALSGYMFIKKKRSRHHAGFIAILVIFTLIFSALYYFPQLRNAT